MKRIKRTVTGDSSDDDFRESALTKRKTTKKKDKPTRHSTKPVRMPASDVTGDHKSGHEQIKVGHCSTESTTDTVISQADVAEYSGYCPLCQMPFSVLRADTPEFHVTECYSRPVMSKTECEKGGSCHSSVPSHYWRFKHSRLAEYRSAKDLYVVSQTDTDTPADTVIRSSTLGTELSLNKTEETSPSGTDSTQTASEVSLSQPGPNQNMLPSHKKHTSRRAVKLTKSKGQTSILSYFTRQNSSSVPTEQQVHSVEASGSEGTTSSGCSRSDVITDSNCLETNDVKTPRTSRVFSLFKSNFRNTKLKSSAEKQTIKNCTKKQSYTYNTKKSKKTCPFYKKIPGTPFTVDAFSYGSIPDCAVYFLTHFHYDHYGGLTRTFSHPIYCSKVTANLVEKKIHVNKTHLHCLDINKAYYIHDVEVTLLDANHCPGSVMILFKLRTGQVILHTGDFRATDLMPEYSALKGLHVNQLFLDTTYCDPSYCFPSQDSVIGFSVSVSTTFISSNPTGVVVVGSYTIGKEKVFKAIAEALDCKIYVSSEKRRTLSCLEDECLLKRLTLNSREAKVHVLQMSKLNYKALSSYLLEYNFDKVLAFNPTGWTYSEKSCDMKPRISKQNVVLYDIPYSEHSSFEEMKSFVIRLHPDKIIPTVNNTTRQSIRQMEKYFAKWLSKKNT